MTWNVPSLKNLSSSWGFVVPVVRPLLATSLLWPISADVLDMALATTIVAQVRVAPKDEVNR